jgi:hypothetical protein
MENIADDILKYVTKTLNSINGIYNKNKYIEIKGRLGYNVKKM